MLDGLSGKCLIQIIIFCFFNVFRSLKSKVFFILFVQEFCGCTILSVGAEKNDLVLVVCVLVVQQNVVLMNILEFCIPFVVSDLCKVRDKVSNFVQKGVCKVALLHSF